MGMGRGYQGEEKSEELGRDEKERKKMVGGEREETGAK